MDILNMMRDGTIGVLPGMIIIQTIPIAVVSYLLARAKYRNTFAAALLGLIPVLNYLVLVYYVGIPKQEQVPNKKV
ncbi:hypothetical protein [Pseudoalteromonas piscicida]|uniref:hypothetical protein n=1 Tax=Pseudoalteromonas piscicida TaxID=43662 RepID=UPI00309591D9